MTDLTQKLDGVVVSTTCELRPNSDKDAPRKTITLHVDFTKLTIADAIERAIAPLRINFQNNNRKHFKELADEYTIVAEPLGTYEKISGEDKLLKEFSKLSATKQAEVLAKLGISKS